MITTGYIVADPKMKKFLQEGSGNSEYDGDVLVVHLHAATLFSSVEGAQSKFMNISKGERLTADYWHSDPPSKEDRALGKFMQTCQVFVCQLTVSSEPEPEPEPEPKKKAKSK